MSARVLALARGFGRDLARNPMNIMLTVLPPTLGLFVRALASLSGRFLPGFDPAPWLPTALAIMAPFPAYLTGLLEALMLLDDRDKDLLPAYRVTPLSDAGILAAKAAPAAVLAGIGTPVALLLSGAADRIPQAALAGSAVLAALQAASVANLTAGLAHSKVEGLTVGKAMGTILLASAGWAFLPGPWKFAALIVPQGWWGPLFLAGSGTGLWLAGALAYGLAAYLLSRRLVMKRYFR